MAKKKKKRKKQPQQPKPLKPANYIRKVARKLPIVHCKINDDWQEGGLVSILIARERLNGKLIVGAYLIDTYCLGLKNTFFRYGLLPPEFEELEQMYFSGSGQVGIDCDPMLAQNIIYGGIEYAEDLGFEPDKDFHITQYLLDDVEEIEFIDVEFGKDGKPFLITGPYDDLEVIRRKLEKKGLELGKDVDYMIGLE